MVIVIFMATLAAIAQTKSQNQEVKEKLLNQALEQ